MGASFGSARRLQGKHWKSDSSDDGWDLDYDDYLVETCIEYVVEQNVLNGSDCFDVIGVFLPLCENNHTEFNSTNLNTTDLTDLITEGTFLDGTNVESAVGAIGPNGELGIEVELSDDAVLSFELCLGNVTVDGENVNDFNATTIDTSSGMVIVVDYDDDSNSTEYLEDCDIDGLPCFSLVTLFGSNLNL